MQIVLLEKFDLSFLLESYKIRPWSLTHWQNLHKTIVYYRSLCQGVSKYGDLCRVVWDGVE